MEALVRPLLVGAAYYAGAWVGFATTFPGTGISIVWPPNVILLAALLSTPVRGWWRFGVTTFAAHVLAHSQVGVPALVLIIQFGGNALQAVVAALLLRRLTDWPWRHTLRNSIALIVVAGIAAPAVASFVAAPAYVLAGWVHDFAFAWRVRVLSNLVSTLTLAPLLIAMTSPGPRALRHFPPRRAAEFTMVVAGMLAGALLVAQSAVDPASRSWLHAPMPLLLWAAMRFGPPGLCIALFVIVFIFVSEVFSGPSVAASPAENALALQVFLIAIAVPLQLLAALVEERRRADDRIAESRQRYRMATRAGGVGVWDWDLETHRTYVDPVLKGALGYADAKMPDTIEAWAALVHPDDAALVWDAVRACVDGRTTAYAVEHRMLHRDGTARWFLARGAVSTRRDGHPVRMTGTGTDITERKAAEAALDESSRRIRDLTGRLMVAQEQERRHIARELHDDLSQQVAAISISISNIKRALARGATAERASTELDALQHSTAELAEAIRELSHGLHPAALEHGGLTAGLKSFAAELSRREGLDAAITAVGDDGAIPPHVALALYRIVQESMRNVARHSGARQAQVVMTVSDAAVELLVKDEGSGFDVTRSRRGDGLGLISIEERVRLLQGSLLVTSRPGHGTDLLVTVPLPGALRTDRSPEPAGAVRDRAYWQHAGTGEVWAVETQAGRPVGCAGPITPAAAGSVGLSSVVLGTDDVRIIRAQWPRFVRRDLCPLCDTVILPGASTVDAPAIGRAHLRCALNPPAVHSESAGARVRAEPLWQGSARLATQSRVLHAASLALHARCEALRAAWRRRLLRAGRAER